MAQNYHKVQKMNFYLMLNCFLSNKVTSASIWVRWSIFEISIRAFCITTTYYKDRNLLCKLYKETSLCKCHNLSHKLLLNNVFINKNLKNKSEKKKNLYKKVKLKMIKNNYISFQMTTKTISNGSQSIFKISSWTSCYTIFILK